MPWICVVQLRYVHEVQVTAVLVYRHMLFFVVLVE